MHKKSLSTLHKLKQKLKYNDLWKSSIAAARLKVKICEVRVNQSVNY